MNEKTNSGSLYFPDRTLNPCHRLFNVKIPHCWPYIEPAGQLLGRRHLSSVASSNSFSSSVNERTAYDILLSIESEKDSETGSVNEKSLPAVNE